MPQRFIIRFRGKGPRPDAAERTSSSLRIIDDSARMLLVEGSEDDIRSAFSSDDWLVMPETSIDNPVERIGVEQEE